MNELARSEQRQRELYEQVYANHDERHQRWKQLCARENIGPMQKLLARAGVQPERVIDVGCGDGAVLAEMSERGVGSSFVAYEIAPSAVSYVAARGIRGLERACLFDRDEIPEPDDSFDLGLLHFVIDQVLAPEKLLSEVRRVSRYVFVAVILDDTLSMRAKLRDGHGDRFGRTQLYNRRSIRSQLESGGLTILAEAVRAPGWRESVFWADGPLARSRAYALAGARFGTRVLMPGRAERLFGHSYRAVCERA